MGPALIIIVAVLLFIAIFVIATRNGLIGARNNVAFAKGSVDTMLKKRYDLIPNLVATVKQYGQYEENVLTRITELRSKAIGGTLAAAEQAELNSGFSALGKSFVALSENYPELRASENYQQLQRTLNETEEQIAAARRSHNAAITHYNDKIQMFPGSLFAGGMQMFPQEVPTITETEAAPVDVKKLFAS